MFDANIIPLQQLYLSVIVQLVNAEKLSAVQQQFSETTGRLWLVREGSTVPEIQIAYNFRDDDVTLGIITRDERKLERTVKFAEGLDGFLEDLQKFITANRLAAPKKSAAPKRYQNMLAGTTGLTS